MDVAVVTTEEAIVNAVCVVNIAGMLRYPRLADLQRNCLRDGPVDVRTS